MGIEFKDYYFVLGVSQSAGDEEIRRAFRKLARLYHPDIARDDRVAEDKFKEVNEAYEVLSDPEKRKRYDDFNSRWQSPGRSQPPPGWEAFANPAAAPGGKAEHFTFTGSGFSEFFDQLFTATNRGRSSSERAGREPESPPSSAPAGDGQGDDLEADIWVSLDEVASGAVRTVTMRRAASCPRCFGVGQYNAHRCEECDGSGRKDQIDRFKVRIPQGVPEGTFLRVPAQGDPGVAKNPPGDLYLKVRYTRHADFRVDGTQLCYDLYLAPWEAVLGASILVPTLGAGVQVKIPPGTQAGHRLRLKGKGLPLMDGTPGDLIVLTHIQVPREASSREEMLWRELASSSAFYPREH